MQLRSKFSKQELQEAVKSVFFFSVCALQAESWNAI